MTPYSSDVLDTRTISLAMDRLSMRVHLPPGGGAEVLPRSNQEHRCDLNHEQLQTQCLFSLISAIFVSSYQAS